MKKLGFSQQQSQTLKWLLADSFSKNEVLKPSQVSELCDELGVKRNQTNFKRIRTVQKRRLANEAKKRQRPLKRPKKINSGEFEVKFLNRRRSVKQEEKSITNGTNVQEPRNDDDINIVENNGIENKQENDVDSKSTEHFDETSKADETRIYTDKLDYNTEEASDDKNKFEENYCTKQDGFQSEPLDIDIDDQVIEHEETPIAGERSIYKDNADYNIEEGRNTFEETPMDDEPHIYTVNFDYNQEEANVMKNKVEENYCTKQDGIQSEPLDIDIDDQVIEHEDTSKAEETDMYTYTKDHEQKSKIDDIKEEISEDESDKTSESSILPIYNGFERVGAELKYSNDDVSQSIPTATLESIFQTKLLGEKFFSRKIEENGSFDITDDDWSHMTSLSQGRQMKKGSWSHIILNGIKKMNPYCVFMIKRHYLNVQRLKRKRKDSRILFVQLYCKFKDCGMECVVEMLTQNKLDVRFSGKLKHAISERASRPISGEERKKIGKEFLHGQKPYRYYLQKFNQIPDDVKIAGNFSAVGSSPDVIRKIATEAKKCDSLDPDEWTSLTKMTKQDSPKSKTISGFIQHISIMPSYVMYWSETGVRLWHQLAKNATAYWDATGSVISTGSHDRTFLYYELALANPNSNSKSPSIPITSMISSSHDKPQIQYWLAKFRQSEKALYGHGNVVVPRQVNSDRSLVFIQSALAEFAGETLDSFRTRAWRILNGLASEEDLRKTIPHGCLSHVMKEFRKICQEHYRSNFEYGMYLFGAMVNVDNLKTATSTLTAILYILMSRFTTDLVKKSGEYIDMRIEMLPDSLQPSKECLEEKSSENILLEKEKNPNYFSEEEYIRQRKGNAFSAWAAKIKTEVQSNIPTETDGLQKNNRYSKELAEVFLRRFISLFPIWSNVLLGDLSRYTQKESITHSDSKSTPRKTNATIEQRFRVLKDVYFSGQRFSRLDVFSNQLANHFEAVQKLIAIDQLKPQKRKLKRAKEILEEKWQKQTPPKKDLGIGKYQTKPSRIIETFPKLTKQNKENVKRTNQSQNSQNEHQNEVQGKGPPPSYKSQDMIQDLAAKMFQEDSLFADVKAIFDSDFFLKSMYNDMARQSLIINSHVKIGSDLVGLPNLGNTCWFNAVVQLFSPSVGMLDVDDRCRKDLSLSDNLENFIDVCRKVASGREVQRMHIQRALHEIEKKYKIKAGRQNDAHELVSTAVSSLLSALDSCSIKIVAGNACVECGSNSTVEEQHNDIQLRLLTNGGTKTTSVMGLLDEYFSDEKIIEKEGDQCCGKKRRWRGMRIVSCPNDLFLTLTRYQFSHRIVKIRTKVFLDPIINLGKYMANGEEVIYKLQGCVIHEGNTPQCGHYTFADKHGPTPIMIDDEKICPLPYELASTDGYILRYEKIAPVPLGPECLSHIVISLQQSKGLKDATESHLPEDCLSLRQQKILELMSEFDVNGTHEKGYLISKLLCDGMIQSYNEISHDATEVISSILDYMFGNCTGVLKRSFGVSAVEVGCCETCNHTNFTEYHYLIFDPLLAMTDDQLHPCTVCDHVTFRRIKFITNFGQTLILKGYFNLNDLEKTLSTFPFFQLLCRLSFNVTSVFRPPLSTIMKAETDQWLTIEGYDKTKTKEKAFGQPSKAAITYVDVTEFTFQKQWEENDVADQYSSQKLLLQDVQDLAEINEKLKWMQHYDQPLNIGNVHVCKEDVSRFLHGEFSDANIDAFLETLKPRHTTCFFVPSSWISTCMNSSTALNVTSLYDWRNYDKILIPALVNNNHWIFLAVCLKDMQILYLDPMGKDLNDRVLDYLVKVLNLQHVSRTGRILIDNWKVCNLTRTGSFPCQKDITSCGAYVCLYARLILENLSSKDVDSTFIRKLIFHDVVMAYYESTKKMPFSIKDIICLEELDEVVHSVCIGKSHRHTLFLQNPCLEKQKALEGFGSDFLPMDDYYRLQAHLHARFFKTRKRLASFETNSIFKDALELNSFVQSNISYSNWYVECVLVKDVLVESISRRFDLSREDALAQCNATEFSVKELRKKEVKRARQANQKLKELL